MFAATIQATLTLWRGAPDSQAAHDYLLQRLRQITGGRFLPPGTTLSTRIKGNLGEVCAFWIGRDGPHTGWSHVFTLNCLEPLKDISSSGVDIVWIAFNDADPAQDFVVLQETKATATADLGYADSLVDDYLKLFGTDLSLTLHSRFQGIKNQLEFAHNRPDLCLRLNKLGGQAPADSPKVRLLPTLIHDTNGRNPALKLAKVRTALLDVGWGAGQVSAWSVALDDLDGRLARLSWGQP